MNKVLLPQNKNEVLEKTSQNLGIYNSTPGNYLSTVVDGLYNFNSEVNSEINEVISELYIETASISTLESFGARKGIPRLKNKNITVNAGDNSMYIKPVFYRPNSDLTINLFTKNQIVKADIFIITFLEDVVYNSNLDRVYVSCTITLNSLYDLTYDFIDSNTVVKLPIPRQHSALIESLTFEVEKDVYFSSYNETELAYRDRLRRALRSENISGESYIQATLESMPYVDQYFIMPESYPTKLYLLNNLMYSGEDNDVLLDEGSLSLGTSLIDQVKSYGSNFELIPAQRITLSLNIEMDFVSNFIAYSYLSSLPDFIYNKHVLGKELIINKDMINLFFKDNFNESVDFNLKISLYFNGISILNEVEDSLLIQKNEFPTIFQVLFNGESIDA